MAKKEEKEFDLTKHLSADHKSVLRLPRKLENYFQDFQTDSSLEKAERLLDMMQAEMNVHFKKKKKSWVGQKTRSVITHSSYVSLQRTKVPLLTIWKN